MLSHYNFNEYTNSGITGFTPSHVTTRANILALNSSYLFSYDGKTLIAWNKTNGSKLDTIVVSSIYNGGQARTHEGFQLTNVMISMLQEMILFMFLVLTELI